LLLLLAVIAKLALLIDVLPSPAPMTEMFLSDQLTPEDHVQVPAGTDTMSPSFAAFTLFWISEFEQLSALRVAALTFEISESKIAIKISANFTFILFISIPP
jgi:hypothetical protein